MATEKNIGGRIYRCEKLPAMIGLPYALRLLKIMAHADDIIALTLRDTKDRSDDELDAELLAAMSRFLINMDVDEITKLVTELIEQSCSIGGDKCIVGVNPQDLAETLEVFVFALRYNFADFFGASGPLAPFIGKARRKVA